MTARRHPRDLRAGLASLYAGAAAPSPAPAAEAQARPGIGALGGAPALFVEQQKQGLLQENAALRDELRQLREDGGADMLLDPALVRDRFPPDRSPHAFADEAFQALKRSIAEHGQDQPILVRPHGGEPDAYEIAYGRRRREACRQLGIKVRARVKPLSDEELLRVMVRENEEREALSLYERAAFARRLAEAEGLSVRRLGTALGISPGYVSRLLRLPVLPPALEELIGDPRPLSMRVLEELAAVLADGEAVVDRVLQGWAGLRPGPTPERRARQVIALARAAPAAGPRPQAGGAPGQAVTDEEGRVLGRLVRRADGTRALELAAGLGEDEIELLLSALRTALAGKGRGV